MSLHTTSVDMLALRVRGLFILSLGGCQMRLTPEVLRATYAFLHRTLPFCRWRMPIADEVEFHVKRFRHMADAVDAGEAHQIRLSERRMSHTFKIVETMAHEMVHVHLDRNGVRSEHGPQFRRAWRLVCKHHGFDPADC